MMHGRLGRRVPHTAGAGSARRRPVGRLRACLRRASHRVPCSGPTRLFEKLSSPSTPWSTEPLSRAVDAWARGGPDDIDNLL